MIFSNSFMSGARSIKAFMNISAEVCLVTLATVDRLGGRALA